MPEACFALIRFKDMKGAEHWVQASPIFKQKDWPAPADELELFVVDLSYVPLEGILLRKHLRTKVTPDFHVTYSKNGGNLESESQS